MDLRSAIAVVISVIVAGLIILGLTSAFLIDWAWFAALGYVQVFWTMLGAKALLFGAVFVGSAILLWVNGAMAQAARTGAGRVTPDVLYHFSMSIDKEGQHGSFGSRCAVDHSAVPRGRRV